MTAMPSLEEKKYKKNRVVSLGGRGLVKKILIGGENPCSLQTMWKSPLINADLTEVRDKILELQLMGMDIIRFAVPDMESAEKLVALSKICPVPLVADIHFDYKLALKCMEGDVAKIRINPGNIGSQERVKKVVEAARKTGTPLRIGINGGSLPKDLNEKVLKGDMTRSQALVSAAEREVEYFDREDFSQIIVSMKASSVQETISCNRLFASKYDIPLHLGVTEAGPLVSGSVKNAVALYTLLREGIGSTIRVSLSDSVENEIIAGRTILEECGYKKGGVTLVSCPRCGRVGFDVHEFVKRWQKELMKINKNITVAVMGCVVNGPGEAKHADIGITGVGDKVYIFKKGEIAAQVSLEDADNAFRRELDSL